MTSILLCFSDLIIYASTQATLSLLLPLHCLPEYPLQNFSSLALLCPDSLSCFKDLPFQITFTISLTVSTKITSNPKTIFGNFLLVVSLKDHSHLKPLTFEKSEKKNSSGSGNVALIRHGRGKCLVRRLSSIDFWDLRMWQKMYDLLGPLSQHCKQVCYLSHHNSKGKKRGLGLKIKMQFMVSCI